MQEDLGNPEKSESTPVFCLEHAEKGRKLFKTKGAASLKTAKKERAVKHTDLLEVQKMTEDVLNIEI
jgi:hypothetical protein